MNPKLGQSQIASDIVTDRAPPHETVNEIASANIAHTITCGTTTNYCSSAIEQWQTASAIISKDLMSSQRERIKMVAQPPQHINPCATQLNTITNSSRKKTNTSSKVLIEDQIEKDNRFRLPIQKYTQKCTHTGSRKFHFFQ